MNQVAAIVYIAHDKAFVRALEATGVWVYTLTREGLLQTVQGLPATRVAGIGASHVVWVGVPKKWVGKLGALRFVSTYTGSRRWTRNQDPIEAITKIRAAVEDAHKEAGLVRQQREKEHAATVEAARKAALFAPAPLYIPQELR